MTAFSPNSNASGGSAVVAGPPTLTWNIAEHVAESYSGWKGLAHIGAVGATWLLVETKVDAEVQTWAARRNETLSIATSAPALIGGFFIPAAVPFYMLRSDESRIRNGGLAVGQAVGVSFAITTLLKAITGRVAPDAGPPHTAAKRSRRFRFGFFRGGIIDGWPSGHTMSNMALASSLSSYFNESRRVKFVTYGWATYVMTAATFGIQGGVHWLSDVVAGGLISWTIGTTIGKRFAQGETTNKDQRPDFQWAFYPVATANHWGFQLTFPAH